MLSYLAGSISAGIIAGKLLKGIDIRNHGSGNAGATNIYRIFGWKAGFGVLLFDVFKGFFAARYLAPWLASASHLEIVMMLAGFASVLGHVFPVFAGFRGGKGVATLGGVLLAVNWPSAAIGFLVFLGFALCTGIASLASIAAAITVPVSFIFYYKGQSHLVYGASFLIPVFVILTHRSNVKRIIRGEESAFRKKKPVSSHENNP